MDKPVKTSKGSRSHLGSELPDELPPGPAELYLEFLQPKTTRVTFADFAGCLKDDSSFVGDALEIQRKMRDEW